MKKGYRMLFAAPRLLDCYPLSSSPYAVYPKGDARQQLLEVFEKPYMHEVIHVCLSPNEWRKATSSSINRKIDELWTKLGIGDRC